MTDSTFLRRDQSPRCLSLAVEIDFNFVLKWGLIKLEDRLLIAISSSQRTGQTFQYCLPSVMFTVAGHRITACFILWISVQNHIRSVWFSSFLWHVFHVKNESSISHFLPFSPCADEKHYWISSWRGRYHTLLLWLVQYSSRSGFASSESPPALPLCVTAAVAIARDPVALLGAVSCLEFLGYEMLLIIKWGDWHSLSLRTIWVGERRGGNER